MTTDQIEMMKLLFQAISSLGIIGVLIQIVINNKWNRVRNVLENKWEENHLKLSEEIEKLEAQKMFSCQDRQISSTQISSIKAQANTNNTICEYLGIYEYLGLAYFRRAIDRKMAYALYSTDLIKAYEYFEPFICNDRATDGDELVYKQFERLFHIWKRKYLKEQKRIKNLNSIKELFIRRM